MPHSESFPSYTGLSELYLELRGKKNFLFVKEGNITRYFRAQVPKLFIAGFEFHLRNLAALGFWINY